MSTIEKTASLEAKAEIGKRQIMNKNYQVYFGFILFNIYAQKALAAGDKSDSSGGLPQLDISTWPTQLFWLLITFSIGYIIISTLVVPSISTVLENRSDKISSDVQKAKNANENAKKAFSSYEASLTEARTQAANTLANAVNEAKSDTAKREAALDKKLATNAKKAEESLAEVRKETLSSLEELATEISQKIISDLTPVKVTKSVVKKHVSLHAKLQN